MTVTAARLGSSPLTFDWSHLAHISAGAPPKGAAESLSPKERFEQAWSSLKARFQSKEVGFYDSPISAEISQINESAALARSILAQGKFTDFLFLGIGGSSLGPISLLGALFEKCDPSRKFYFLENPDPYEWKSTLSGLNPETTLVCIVTKSGTTFETLAQALLALDWLGIERWKTHCVAITDPKKGDLKQFATHHEIPCLSIDPSLGGRFSVFSPVGLFPAALAGLNIEEFLLGAKQVRDYCEKASLEKNPIFILAAELLRHAHKRPVHVCMPYTTRLRQTSSWFVQLWGESIGKDGKGFTPIAALGATDQHSILQLLRDGPDDKITFFITQEKVADPVRIPKLPSSRPMGLGKTPYPAFEILEGHSLQGLLQVEYQAIAKVLSNQGRPHVTLQIEQLDERNMGALFFAFCVLTAVTGTLWNVNPFDQPGVEEGKVYIRESLQKGTSQMSPEEDSNSAANRLRLARESMRQQLEKSEEI